MAFYDYAFKITPVLVLVISLYVVFREQCHVFEPAVHSHLGTRSPYRAVANLNTDTYSYSGCSAIKIWSIIRHGTRTPKTKLIKVMKDRLYQLKTLVINNINSGAGELCPGVKTAFENWELSVAENCSQILTHEGEEEMLLLGERIQMRFPEVLSEDYSNDTYKFRYTASQRTKESASYFTTGLFGRDVSHQIWYPEALNKDPILRFYKLCEKWRKTISKNPTTFEEPNKFSKSDVMSNAIDRISNRIGLKSYLQFEDAFLMYQTCCFETAWNSTSVSPWCTIFSQEDAEVFEYYDDLKYYWKDGYGYNLNYEQACPAFNDMIKHFVSETPEPKGIFYFTHSGTLLKMLGFLKLYKDEEILRSSNYRDNFERQWRVSKIDTFGTNLVFILYRCSDGTDKVLTLHQERPVRIPGCPAEHDLCPLNTLMRIYDSSISNCNFDEICSLHEEL